MRVNDDGRRIESSVGFYRFLDLFFLFLFPFLPEPLVDSLKTDSQQQLERMTSDRWTCGQVSSDTLLLL